MNKPCQTTAPTISSAIGAALLLGGCACGVTQEQLDEVRAIVAPIVVPQEEPEVREEPIVPDEVHTPAVSQEELEVREEPIVPDEARTPAMSQEELEVHEEPIVPDEAHTSAVFQGELEVHEELVVPDEIHTPAVSQEQSDVRAAALSEIRTTAEKALRDAKAAGHLAGEARIEAEEVLGSSRRIQQKLKLRGLMK